MHPQSHAQEKFFMKNDTSNNADLVRALSKLNKELWIKCKEQLQIISKRFKTQMK